MSNLALFRDREFLALAGTAFARSQAYSTILIALALYADLFNTSGVVEGLFGTGFALVQLLIVLPLGRAVDTGNAKRYLLAGLALNVVVFFGFLLVTSPTDIVLVRVVQGLAASVLWVTGSSVVGEISPEGSRGRWLGTYNQVGAFSSLAGDVVGGYLLHVHGFSFTYVVLAGITVAAFVLVLGFLRTNPGGQMDPEDATHVETIRDLLNQRMVRSLVLFRVAFSVGKMAVIIFLPIYARKEFGINAFAIGGILAGGKLTKSLLQGYVGDVTDRSGARHRFVVAGALLYAVGVALIPMAGPVNAAVGDISVRALGRGLTVSGAFASMFVSFGILGVADSLRLPASMALFVEEGEAFDSVASSMSLRSISWKFGQVAGPVTIGLVRDVVSWLWAFWVASGLVLVATAIFLLSHRRGAIPARDPAPDPGD
ncbi:MAG: MFS transporter [Halobacteriaceae archaeon]